MNIGKKILSAFVEVKEAESGKERESEREREKKPSAPIALPADAPAGGKFRQHFDRLFEEANIPGPDYFEFSKMIEAMNVIPDERSRYLAAYAGLSVQGLTRQLLLSTADEYLSVLAKDAQAFHATVNAAVQEKVLGKTKEREEKQLRIKALSEEMARLGAEIEKLDREIGENEEKIRNNSSTYDNESVQLKNRILLDIEKIKSHIP